MNRWSCVLLSLLLATLLWMPVHALQPLDNDGGSGRDAGDGPDGAVPIVPGKVQGRMTVGIDGADYYAIDLQEGDVVRVAHSQRAVQVLLQGDAAGTALEDMTPVLTYGLWLAGMPLNVVVPYTGTWYISVHMPATSTGTYIGYSLDVSVEQKAWSQGYHWSSDRVLGVEFIWDEQVEVATSRMSAVRHEMDSAGGSAMFSEWTRTGIDGEQRSTSFGAGVRHAATGELDPLGVELPRQVTQYGDTGYSFFWIGGTGERTSMKHVSLATSDARLHTIAVAADAPPKAAVVMTSDTTFVIEADADGSALAVSSPLARVTSDTSVEFDIQGGLYGLGAIAGQQRTGSTATLTSPSGFVPSHHAVIRDDPGTWRLDVDRSIGAGTETAYPYFFGTSL